MQGDPSVPCGKTAEALTKLPVPRAPPPEVSLNTGTGECVRVQNAHKQPALTLGWLGAGWGPRCRWTVCFLFFNQSTNFLSRKQGLSVTGRPGPGRHPQVYLSSSDLQTEKTSHQNTSSTPPPWLQTVQTPPLPASNLPLPVTWSDPQGSWDLAWRTTLGHTAATCRQQGSAWRR